MEQNTSIDQIVSGKNLCNFSFKQEIIIIMSLLNSMQYMPTSQPIEHLVSNKNFDYNSSSTRASYVYYLYQRVCSFSNVVLHLLTKTQIRTRTEVTKAKPTEFKIIWNSLAYSFRIVLGHAPLFAAFPKAPKKAEHTAHTSEI